MVRWFLTLSLAVGVLGLCVAAEKADTKSGDKKGNEATITKVDQKNHTITVRMKDAQGKEVEKTFKLTEDVRYLDSTGKVAAIDVFQSGNQVLIVEEQGKLKEVHKKADTKGGDTKKETDKKPPQE